ncbi:MAG: hypothetical protein IPP25_15570 [Saprospiraceae bacterium]|nr:hypothetical protein [Candidatus Opimibacter skivensis]
MRLISLTLCIVVITVGAKAQPWLENLPAGKPRQELTFFDYQHAFETYWAPHLVENGTYIENGETKKHQVGSNSNAGNISWNIAWT